MGRHTQPTWIDRLLRSRWLIVAIMIVAAAGIILLQPMRALDSGPQATPVTNETDGGGTPTSDGTTQPTPTPILSTPSTPMATLPPTTTAKPRACRAGLPVRVVWNSPGINVNASIEKVGLDDSGNLGAPDSKKTIGWYSPGPKPGEGRGNVLIDGHTYTNNSAVFKENFALQVKKGMIVSLLIDNGSTCSYKITKVWPNIQKDGEYPRYVAREKFYDFSGPEQLFGVTCSGSWNAIARSHEAVTAFMAAPIN